MKSIYKYKLDLGDECRVSMHKFARILCVQTQGRDICVWAEVDTEHPIVDTQFWIVGTGHSRDTSDRNYVGTVQQNGFVWHVYTLCETATGVPRA